MSATPRLVSFDVFDTVVTRRVGSPAGVFWLLGRRLAERGVPVGSPARFVKARQCAESRVRRVTKGAEPSLREIWTELEWVFAWPAGTGVQLMDLEIAAERDVIVAVPGAGDEIQAFRDRGVPVRFVSDTYLSGITVTDLMRHAGIQVIDGECWVSNEHRVSKRFGGLFGPVLSAAGVDPREALHIGNDAAIDGRGAARAGLHSSIRPAANLTRFERHLDAMRDQTDGLGMAVAAASRMARLLRPAPKSAHEQHLTSIAAGVVGPVLTGYILWLLRDAAARGLTRLYFVSRDGQILKALAEAVSPCVEHAPELRYLYGSRLAWMTPSFGEPSEALDWMLNQSDTLDISRCLQWLGLDEVRADRLLEANGIQRGDRDVRASFARLSQSEPALLTVREALQQSRERTRAYLRQEGLAGSPARHGFVDIGWKGSLYASLGRLIGSDRPECAYHFGLAPGLPLDESARINSYLFDLVAGRGYCDLGRRAALLVETFCAGSEGVATAYSNSGGVWSPTLSPAVDRKLVDWGVAVVHETVAEFGRQIAASPIAVADADWRPLVSEMIELFWEHPDADDARSWGSFPVADGPAGTTYRPFAVPYGGRHIVEALRTGHVDRPHSCAWPTASHLLTPNVLQGAIATSLRNRARLSAVWRRLRRRLPQAAAGAQK